MSGNMPTRSSQTLRWPVHWRATLLSGRMTWFKAGLTTNLEIWDVKAPDVPVEDAYTATCDLWRLKLDEERLDDHEMDSLADLP